MVVPGTTMTSEGATAGCEVLAPSLRFRGFGAKDVVVIFEAPDATSAIALSMTLGTSGAASDVETTPLLTTEEAMAAMKQAAKTASAYKAPA